MWDADLWWVAVRRQGDARSDLSAIHHLRWSDAMAMPGDELGSLLARLVHYPGAVQASALKAYRQSTPAESVPTAHSTSSVPVDPTPEQVRALRDAARRKKYGPEFGEHKHVDLGAFMAEASKA